MNKVIYTAVLFTILSFSNLSYGDATDEKWRNAKSFTRFFETVPFTNNKTENAEIKITSDQTGIQVKFEISDYDSQRKPHISPRDGDLLEDYVEFIIDLKGNGNSAFGFRVSVNGSTNDFIIDEEKIENRDWDGEWEYDSELEDGIWQVELLIPWSTTLINVNDENEIKAAFYVGYWNHQKRSKVSIPSITRNQSRFVSNFQPITLHYETSQLIKLTPFVTYEKETTEKTNDERAGLTFLWKQDNQGVSYAYKPDFGQVDSNELVLNLSAIETFFSEKREFFLDEQELYLIEGPESLRVFHSPRIGSFSGPNDENLNIQHAIKYNLDISSVEIGALYSNEEDISGIGGREFKVFRTRYSDDEMKLGVLSTRTESPSLDRVGTVYAIDYQIDIDDSSQLYVFLARSDIDIAGLPTKKGEASLFNYSWDWSEHWSNNIALLDYDKDFDLSDAGFVSRVNRKQIEIETELEIVDYDDNSWIESSEHSIEYQSIKNQLNSRLGEAFASSNKFILNTKNILEIEAEYFTDYIDDYLTRGNNPVSLPAAYIIEVDLESPPYSGWSHSVDIKTGKEGISGDFTGFGANITYSLTSNVTFGFGLDRVAYDSYLIWDEENIIDNFHATETEYELFLNSRFDDIHFLDIKLESVALKARALSQYEANSSGQLIATNEEIEDQSIGEVALQIRYHYRPSRELDVYAVYTRGGEIEQDDTFLSSSRLIRNAYKTPETSRYFIKAQYSF